MIHVFGFFFHQEGLSILLSSFATAGQQIFSLRKFVSSVLDPETKSTQTLQAFANALTCYFEVSTDSWSDKDFHETIDLHFQISFFFFFFRNTKRCCRLLKKTL